MILDKYHRGVQGALKQLVERTNEQQTNLAFRKSSGFGASFTPSATCEEVAMNAVELSSRARTLKEVQELLNESYRSLFEKDNNDEQD